MRLESTFDIGDKVWCTQGTGPVHQLTVGMIRVQVTDSPGRIGEEIFDNFKPQKGYEEEYMCVETGIRSGSVFTLGRNIFATKYEAQSAVNEYRLKMENNDG